jgi:hypothetical protein
MESFKIWMGTLSLETLVEYRYKFVCYFVCPSNSVGRGTVCLSSRCLGTGVRAADKVVDVGRVQEIFNEEWCLQVMYPCLLEWFLGGCDIS